VTTVSGTGLDRTEPGATGRRSAPVGVVIDGREATLSRPAAQRAAADSAPMETPEDLIEVELARVVIQEKGDQQILLLRQRSGQRSFSIVIGFNEAAEINRKVLGYQSLRPLTHDLLGRVLEKVDWRLARVVVNDLRDHTFYANLVLSGPGDGPTETREVDCRPSDAICLAVQTHAPIFVKRKVLDVVG
jgi:bifunctional DNase/RNase